MSGEQLLGIRDVARCYHVDVAVIERWIAIGLLPAARDPGGRPSLPAVALERVATIVRLTRVVGFDAQSLLDLVESGALPPSHPLMDDLPAGP